MHLRIVYFFYTLLSFSLLLIVPAQAGELHGSGTPAVHVRPKTSQLSPEAEEANQLLSEILADFAIEEYRPKYKFSQEELTEHIARLRNFPDLLKQRRADILALLKSKTRGESVPQGFCLELLALMKNPEDISLFETFLSQSDRIGEIRFPAALGLSRLYKDYLELLTAERKEVLFKVLSAKDDNDLARLYLRQLLPAEVAKELDENIYVWQKAHQPPQALFHSIQSARKEAEQLASNENAPPAHRALGFQALLDQETPKRKLIEQINQFLKKVVETSAQPPEKIRIDEALLTDAQKERLEEFIKRTNGNPRGLGLSIHDGIQIEQLLTIAQKKQIELDTDTTKKIRELTNKQFAAIWNGGASLVRYDGDSNLSSYAQAALIASQDGRPLSPTLNEMLRKMGELRGQINPQTGMPHLYNYTSESYRKDATPASSAGRALTNQLAFYQNAGSPEKAQEAQELLQATKNFESHFSQLFEVASFSRTHDRNARGEGMATYYGFGNVPYAAEALVSLKNDRSLNESQQNEVRWLSERIANRLLNMMRSDKRFTDDPRYNVLAGIALQKLDSSFGHSKRK